MSQRDKNSRVWEITKWQQVIDPETNEPNIIEVKSLVREKGCGICYKDCNEQWQITDTSWRQTANGFVMDKANYSLAIGKTANSILKYAIDKEVLNLQANSIKISDGSKETILAAIKETKGYVDADNKNKLIYPNAFGEGIDLEFEVQPDGFRQNVIFKNKPQLPDGFSVKTAEIKISTELSPAGTSAPLQQSTQRCKLKDDIEFVNHRFIDSKIMQTTNGKAQNLAEADKQIIEDSGKNYLVESLKFSELQNANYPVVWDYHTVSSNITTNQIWYADATYYVSGNINLSNGAELKIEPGTIIKFDNGKSINAKNGKLTAKGDRYEYIVCTSKYDAAMGENIAGGTPVPGGWDGIYIAGNSTVKFCKIGYADFPISLLWQSQAGGKIENNIIYQFGSTGIGGWIDNGADGTYNIQNNLVNNSTINGTYGIYFVCTNMLTANATIINNTIANNSYGVYCLRMGGTGGSIDIKNNLLANCSTNSIYVYNIPGQVCNNGFYNAALTGSNYVNCTVSPFDTTNAYLGSYFLDAQNGANLIDAGYGNASDYYGTPGNWTVHHISNTSSTRVFTSTTTLSTDTTWQPTADVDTGTVDIGYHHPRVDYVLMNEIGIGDGEESSTLTISPGTVVAMNSWIVIGQPGAGSLFAEGVPDDNGYIHFTKIGLVSADWDTVQYKTEPRIIMEEFANSSGFCFVRMYNVGLGAPYPIGWSNTFFHDNILKYNQCAYILRSSYNKIANNLFIYNNYGIWVEEAESGDFFVENCTFDRNYMGVCSITPVNLSVKNSIFSNNTKAISIDWEYGQFYITESYNCYYNNLTNYYIDRTHIDEPSIYRDIDSTDWAYPADNYAATLSGDPYYTDWEDFDDRFYLNQNSGLVDGGDQASELMPGYTTDAVAHSIDSDAIDIGYHYPVADLDSDSDGVWDYEEYWLGTNPTSNDSDDDELNDYDEVRIYGTDPLDNDTDDDSYSDGYEVSRGTDSLDPLDHPAGYPVVVTMNTSDSAVLPSDAKWYLDSQSSTQYSSGQEVMVVPGYHTIRFVVNSGTPYIQPSNISINITSSWVNNYSATYNACGWLQVNPHTPSGLGEIYSNYGLWRIYGETSWRLPDLTSYTKIRTGSKTIEFKPISSPENLETPSNYSLTVQKGQYYSISVTYRLYTVYVENSYGSNSNNGTYNQPFATIQYALGKIASSGTIKLMNNSYYESLSFPTNRTINIRRNASDGNWTTIHWTAPASKPSNITLTGVILSQN
jgi:hypothetical protein